MTQDNLCYGNKPHNYKPIGNRTLSSGEQIPILECTRCDEQSPSELEIAGMDAETGSRSLERKLVPDSSRESHTSSHWDTHPHFEF